MCWTWYFWNSPHRQRVWIKALERWDWTGRRIAWEEKWLFSAPIPLWHHHPPCNPSENSGSHPDISLSLTSHMDPSPSPKDSTSCLSHASTSFHLPALTGVWANYLSPVLLQWSNWFPKSTPILSTHRGPATSVFSHFLKPPISLSQALYARASICQEHRSLHPPPSSTCPSLAYSSGIGLNLTPSGRPSLTTSHPTHLCSLRNLTSLETPWGDLGFGDM